MTRPGHVHEEEAFAPEEALRDAALQLHLVAHRRLHHHHAARVDDELLSVGEIEVEEVSAAVEPHGSLPLQPLQEEALAPAVDAHAELLRERALDRDVAVVAEVRVLLADDLAVELVLADRARERPGDPDGAGPVRLVPRQEEALAREQLALQAAGETAGHLDVHRDVPGGEHHRAGLRGQLFAGLESHDDCRRLPFSDGRVHRSLEASISAGAGRAHPADARVTVIVVERRRAPAALAESLGESPIWPTAAI